MSSDNPYHAPDIADHHVHQMPKHNNWDHPVVWIIIAGLNLPVCLGLATEIRDNHFYGVVPGIAIVMVGGLFLQRHKPSVLRSINSGGLITAALQLFPILQIACGVIALKLAGVEIRPSIKANIATVALVTVITATLLMTVAWGFGMVLSVIFPRIHPARDPRDRQID